MNIASFIPEVTSVEEIYPAASHAAQKARWASILSSFEEKYGHPASFVSRAPGRVNIIGEHIDYMLFPVFPMAVESDMLLAVRILPSTSTITLINTSSTFPPRSFPSTSDLTTVPATPDWSDYFKAGYRGALEFLRRNNVATAVRPPGMDILVDGSVPSAAGLSSSAALVCASALAAMVSMGVATVDKKELVALGIVSERYVGVNSGGMDQSASVLGTPGCALHISFDPLLSADAVAFPDDPEPVFLIANTCKKSQKQVTAPVQYNLRVVETTLAAEVMASVLGVQLPLDAAPLGASLKGLMDVYFEKNPGAQDAQQKFDEMRQMVEGILYREDGYSAVEIAKLLGTTEDALVQRYMTKFPVRAERFQLRARAQHVFTEAARVDKMYQLLKAGGGGENTLKQVGKLMNDSQTSCRELFDCSCPELDELCRLAREAGSYGSRLTGAGWGGCSVHLVPREKVEAVRKAWEEGFYSKLDDGAREGEVVVESRPGAGAVLFRVT